MESVILNIKERCEINPLITEGLSTMPGEDIPAIYIGASINYVDPKPSRYLWINPIDGYSVDTNQERAKVYTVDVSYVVPWATQSIPVLKTVGNVIKEFHRETAFIFSDDLQLYPISVIVAGPRFGQDEAAIRYIVNVQMTVGNLNKKD
jgi:hypothetical protein